MYAPQNYLKRLLDAGVISQEDLQAAPTNELRKLLMPGDSGGFVRREDGEDPGQTMVLNGQPGGAFDAVPQNALARAVNTPYPDQTSRMMDQQPMQSEAMAPPQRPSQVQIKMAGFGNDGIMSDLGSTTGPVPQLDMTRPQVDTPKGKGYYGKDGAVYVPGPEGFTKVMLGYDRAASMQMNKADLDRRKGEQDIQQSKASVAHTQEQIRASQVNTPDMVGGGSALGPTGETALQGVDAGTAGLVKALAEGRMAFPGGMAMRSPRMMQLLNLVSAYDPTFDATDYNARNKTLSGFTGGKQGDAVRAVNQAISHAGSLSESIDKLDNFNGLATPLNAPVNAVEQMFGDSRQVNFKQNALALSSELRKVFAGSGGGSLSELQSWESGLPLNASKEQQKAYLGKGLELLNGAIGALNDQYTRGMGSRANVMDIISPKAKATLEKLTGGGASSGAIESDSMPNPAQYNGKMLTDKVTGTKYVSDGSRWMRQ